MSPQVSEIWRWTGTGARTVLVTGRIGSYEDGISYRCVNLHTLCSEEMFWNKNNAFQWENLS
jgi:hypothetical protein